MALAGGEFHLQRVEAAATEIRRDLAAAGRALPDEAIVQRAADIVASYPDAWSRYDAPPDDWEGRLAVATLWTWRQVRAAPGAGRAAAA